MLVVAVLGGRDRAFVRHRIAGLVAISIKPMSEYCCWVNSFGKGGCLIMQEGMASEANQRPGSAEL